MQASELASKFAALEAKTKSGALAALRLTLTRIAKGELAVRVAAWAAQARGATNDEIEAIMKEAMLNEEALTLALADQALLRDTVTMLQATKLSP